MLNGYIFYKELQFGEENRFIFPAKVLSFSMYKHILIDLLFLYNRFALNVIIFKNNRDPYNERINVSQLMASDRITRRVVAGAI